MNKLTRRDFVKKAAVGAAVVAGAGALASCVVDEKTVTETVEVKPWLPDKWDEEVDVVVVGGGTAGLPAAIEAHDAGADVLLIEKVDWLGGMMRRCGGGIAGGPTIVQEKLGITDSPDSYYDYLIAVGEGLVDPALIRTFADNAGKNVDWIIEDLGGQPLSEWDFSEEPDRILVRHGLNYSATPVWFEKYGMEPVMRCHWFKPHPADLDAEGKFKHLGFYDACINPDDEGGGGTGLFKPFGDAITARGIRTMMETTLRKLIAGPDREVLGIIVEKAGQTIYIKAKKAVFLGTGGWNNNKSMVKTYLLKEWSPPEGVFAATLEATPEECDGAGVQAAEAIGADTLFMGLGGIGCVSGGGLKISPKAQVIDVFGDVIPRLYAGGCTEGGLISPQYPNCGHGIAVGVCFGRIGGQNAAALKDWD